MKRKQNCWYRLMVLALALILLVPVLAGCGDDNDETTTPAATTPTATTPATTTPAATTPVSTKPVKIGVVNVWTGSLSISGQYIDQAIDVAKLYIKEKGGILGGRPVEFVRYDSSGQVAQASAGFTKLALDDKVSVCGGGASNAEQAALSTAAEQYKIPFFSQAVIPADLTSYPYTVRTRPIASARNSMVVKFILDQLNPKTVGFLADNETSGRAETDDMANKLEAGGVKIVGKQYPQQGTVDLTSYLSRVKYDNPDVLIVYLVSPDSNMSVYKQMAELGGWGNIKTVCVLPIAQAGLSQPAAQGQYFYALWAPGLPISGAQTFERLYTQATGKPPTATNCYSYLWLMTAVEAIAQAGTDDPQQIAAYARSGKLSWDGPLGKVTFGTNGENDMAGIMCQLQEGKMVPVVSGTGQ